MAVPARIDATTAPVKRNPVMFPSLLSRPIVIELLLGH
jgi:hypothetical protein